MAEDFTLALDYDPERRRFRDNRGREYSPDQARHLWESGALDDHNLALSRLVEFDWDENKFAAWNARATAKSAKFAAFLDTLLHEPRKD